MPTNPHVDTGGGQQQSLGGPLPVWDTEFVLRREPARAWTESKVGILAITLVLSLPLLGMPLMMIMVGGLWRLLGMSVVVLVGAVIVALAVGQLRPVREERLRIGAEGVEHVESRARGGDRVRRLPWATLVSVRLDDAGERVLVRTTSAETAVARLGARQQRAAIASTLRDRLRRDGAQIPPRVPPGWVLRRPVPLQGAPGEVPERAGTVVHRGARRVLAATVQGVLAVALVAYQLIWSRNRAPALELAPGWLAIGVVHPRTGVWRAPPDRVIGLHLSGSPGYDDSPARYALAAVLTSGRRRIIDERAGDDALREVATWISEVTGVAVEDAVQDAV